jgi:hypothetical protein
MLKNIKSEDVNFQFSSIRMPLPASYFTELERMRGRIRLGSSSRTIRNKENVSN